jgi:DNA-binding CsgD family transcriptional regulator
LECKSQPALFASFNSHGVKNHTFEIIEECSISELIDREIFFINKYDSHKNGLNCTLGGQGTFGYNHTEESKKKMSVSKTIIDMSEVLRLKKQGLTHKEVIGIMGISSYSVTKAIKGTKLHQIKRSDSDKERVIELKKQGLTYDQISNELGINKRTVYDTLKNVGMTRELKGSSKSDKILKLREQGLKTKDIADEVGVHIATVYKVIKQSGI